MGRIFKHVDDLALRTSGGQVCHQCRRSDTPIYDYWGQIVDCSRAADPDEAEDNPEVFELCAACINGGNVRRCSTSEAEALISQFARDSNAAWEDFHRLPEIPSFAQYFDWPLCCGEWATFLGSPGDLEQLRRVQHEAQEWRQGPAEQGRDFDRDGPPESFTEVSEFTCRECGHRWYTDQFT